MWTVLPVSTLTGGRAAPAAAFSANCLSTLAANVPEHHRPSPTQERTLLILTPDDREFGILIGKVEAIGEQVAELRRTNSEEHAANGERLERLESSVRESLNQKASEAWVKEHETRIDSLEKTRDEGSGAARLVRFVQGGIAVGLAAAAFLAGKGGL